MWKFFTKKRRVSSTAEPKDTVHNLKHALSLFIRLLSVRKKDIMIVLLMSLIGSVMYTLIPWFMGISIDRVAQLIQDNGLMNFSVHDVIRVIQFPIIALILVSIISFIVSYIQERIMASVAETSGTYLRMQITDKMTKLPLKFYDDIKVGEILSRNAVDIERVAEILVVGFNQFLSAFLNVLFGFSLMLWISPQMTVVVLVLILVSSYVTALISKKSQVSFTDNLRTLGTFNSLAEELFTGNMLVKVFNQQDFAKQRIRAINDEQHDAHLRAMFMNYAIYPLIRFLNQLAFIVSAVYGSLLAIQGRLSVGVIQAYLQYVSQVSEPITEVSFIVNSFQAALASLERIQEILDLDEEESDVDALEKVDNPQGQIEFSNVRFGYSKDQMIMNNVSFDVKPKQMVAIVGPTGAGKTTLINLLMRFYDVNEGSILFDGVSLMDMTRKDARALFGMVLQDAWLFEGTVRQNIAYGRMDASMDDIVGAAKLAQCHDFIEKLPQGYDTVLSSDANIVSEGQLQLLTIARTALVNPPVLILDEATSNIDTITEIKIQDALNTLMKDRTSFVIAHRLSTIQDADLILVMDKGNVVESGNHSQLLDKGGMYAKLYNSQFVTD